MIKKRGFGVSLALVTSVSCLALGVASPAFAQGSDSAATGDSQAQAGSQASAGDAATDSKANVGIQEIVVTAQFRKQNLQDTPLAITAIDSKLLNERGQTDIAQVAAQAPNVTLVPGGSVFGPSIGGEIRGVGQFDFNPAYEPGVGLYIDDVYYSTLTGGMFDLLDLDRVEILRGPQGTLTGRNSEGGAIKLFSKKPDDSGDGFLEASYGSRNKISLRGGADFVLADGLYGRLAGTFKQQDGYVDAVDYGCANPNNAQGIPAYRAAGQCTFGKLGETSQQAVRGQLRYNPSNAVDITLSGDYTHEDRQNSAEVLTSADQVGLGVGTNSSDFFCGKYCTYLDYRGKDGLTFADRNQFSGGGASLNAVFNLQDHLSLTSITAYRKYTAKFGTDDDFTPNPAIPAGGNNRLNHHFFSQEIRLNGQVGTMLEFTVGGYYSKEKTTYYTFQDIGYIVPGPAPLEFVGNDPVNAKSEAVFGTAILKPTAGLTLTGGLRYTHESKDYTFSRRGLDGATLDPTSLAAAFGLDALDGLTSSYSGSRVDYRGSVDYRFSPAIMVYATYSTGFKGGGVSARPFNATQALQGSFKPEVLTNYEIGTKTNLLDRRVRFNVSAFIDDYTNIQLALSDCASFGGGPCGVVANAGDAQFKGVELELDADPVEGLSFDGSLSYLTSKYTSINSAVGASVQITDPATSAPKWKWSAGLQYKADLGSAGSLTPRFDIAYNGAMFQGRGLGVPYSLASYTLANAHLTWRNEQGDLSITGDVSNLFDKYYYTSIFDAVYSFSGTAYQQVARPREYSITIRKNF